tara:strand:- start:763 stop:2517 length:1755 start_codon:yes stop_codon:yes gene_type:complete
MSREAEKTNSVRPIELKNVVDPRLDCLEFAQKQMEWGIFKGAEGQNTVQQQANSYSTSGVSWNFNSQSENTIIDRRIYARVQFLVTFVGTAPVGMKLLNTESDAPRCLPLASITNSLKVTINGSSVETQYSSALLGLLRYNLDDEVKERDLSMSPMCQDKYQRYVDGVGSVRNPLSNYQNSGKDTGRGAFSFDAITNPFSVDAAVPITATCLFTVTEPLLISPMKYKSSELSSGFIGVQNMGVSFNFSAGQLERVWSRSPSPGVNLTSVVCSLGAGTTAPPSLLVNYLTPPLLSQSQIPKQVNYQYYKCETYVNDMNTTLAASASQTFTNNAIQLSTVPKCIYIWASRPESSKTYLTTDTFFRINSLSLNYLNVSGQFSSMSIQDLYQMCVSNGCNLSWTEWSGRALSIGESTGPGTLGSVDGMVGSCIKISIKDLHIPSNVASGLNLNSQLSFSVNVENVNVAEPVPVALTTVLVYDGLMTISNGSMATQVGVISERDVVETRKDRDNYIDWSSAQSIYGGDLFSKLGHFAAMGKRGLDAVCSVKDMVGMGHGMDKPEHHGKKKAHGGQLLSRGELKSRMFDY